MSVCNGSGKFGGRDYSSDALPSYLLYFVLWVRDNRQTHSRSSSWRGRSRGTATEADTIGEQQPEVGAIGEQQLKRMQLGSSSWSGCN